MANSETYPARSALGDLLLHLTFQDCPYAEQVTSARFWEPVWDHNRLDVWDLKAAPAFRAGELLTPDADAGTQNAYRHFQRAQSLRQRMRGVADLGRDKAIACLIEEDDFFRLGSNPELISDAEETLQDSPHLMEMMGILFAHPLWNVAETAASVLTSIIERDERHKIIVNSLFEHRYWRVQFGAIEAAYQLAATDRMTLFGKAVRRFYAHENSRVRALCAENLIAYILDRPADLREFYLRPPDKEAKSNNPDISFHAEIERWLKDADCWVLEHVFRLLKTLDRDRSPRAGQSTTSSSFFANGMPPLLDGLPRSDWDRLPRETFLKHIETRKRELMPAA